MQYDKRTTHSGRPNHSQPGDFLKSQDTLDLRDFWKTLVRHKRMVTLVAGTAITLTLIVTFVSKPTYQSTATLQVEREPTKVVEVDFLGAGDIRDTRDFYQTQFELIRSRALAAKVIKDLGLDKQPPNISTVEQIKRWLGLSVGGSDNQAALEKTLLDNLTVEPVKNSRLVYVHYEDSSPEQAAKVANAIVTTFEKMNRERRIEATSAAQTYLTKSIEEAKGKLEESEQRSLQYARDHEIFQIEGEEITANALSLKKLTEKLVQAQNQRIEKESKYQLLSDKKRKLADRIGVLENNSSTLQTWAQQLDILKSQQAKKPDATVKSQIRNIESKIDVEIAAKLSSLKGEFDAAQKEETLTREAMSRAKEAAMKEQDSAIGYSTLKREVSTNQELYQDLLKRIKDVSLAGGVGANNITIVYTAQVPTTRFKPNLATNLSFGVLLGLLLGISAAFLREFLDDRVKDVNELERETQLPILGIVPEVLDNSPSQLAQLTIKEPKSTVAESFRSLRTAMRFALRDENKNIIFVTSACAGEGKSTTATNLACAYANAGNKVLIIDADLRNPSLHRTLEISATSGLADYLAGKTDLSALVQTTGTNNLSMIPAGTLPEDPAELLASDRMHNLLATARETFDQIILDGPPVLGLADALILSSLSTTTLLAVRAQNTRMGAIGNALKRLRQSQAPLAGILLNRVDMRKGNGYGYDYADYYYSSTDKAEGPKPERKVVTALRSLKLL